ncbi:hypothetical protein MRX96_012202 [Rhipicephalus microplus]
MKGRANSTKKFRDPIAVARKTCSAFYNFSMPLGRPPALRADLSLRAVNGRWRLPLEDEARNRWHRRANAAPMHAGGENGLTAADARTRTYAAKQAFT